MSETDKSNDKGQPDSLGAALLSLCPRCGARTLFSGWIAFADKCENCDLDYRGFNVGDGPASFLILIIGALVTGLAIWLQLSFEPPWWVHAILWIPFTTVAVIFGLRLAKAWLLVLEYRRDAQEHRLENRPDAQQPDAQQDDEQ